MGDTIVNVTALPIDRFKNTALTVDALLARHAQDRIDEDEPLLYIDRAIVQNNVAAFRAAFPEHMVIHYAMKSNPAPEMLRFLDARECRFEIASYEELRILQEALADTSGIAQDVLFSNPVKSPRNIRQAYDAGIRRFAFQGENELQKIRDNTGDGTKVYLRIATSLGTSIVASESKYGMHIATSEQQAEAVRLMVLARSYGIEPYGVAFHVGSQMETTEAWSAPIATVGSLMSRLQQEQIILTMLDIGGGFPAYHNNHIPTIATFGQAITRDLQALPYQPDILAIEPGRAIASDAGAMVATIIGVEERGKERWVYLNVGAFNGFMEALETGNKLRYAMAAEAPDTTPTVRYVVSGPSCDGQDTITYNQALPNTLKVGQRLVVYAAGAYTTAYASNFNGFCIPRTLFI